MTTLKERLAALKAKAAAPTVTEAIEEAQPVVEAVVAAISPIAVEEPAPQERPLTFAEKMALKRQGITAAQTAPPSAPSKPTTPVEIDPSTIPENPEDAQAYVDIKHRIHALESKFDDELSNAMSELKAALKKNPNAVSLMLYSDVGKMVSALYRMADIKLVEQKEGKKPGRKKTEPKAVDLSKLTPEALAEISDF